jgi:hypothetical protein
MVINTDRKITGRVANERYSKGRKPVIHLTGEKVENKRTVRKKIENKFVRIEEELTLRISTGSAMQGPLKEEEIGYALPCRLVGTKILLVSFYDLDSRMINRIRSTIDDEGSSLVLHIREI